MGHWFDVILLVGLILINGTLAMSEIALVTSRKARLQNLAEEGVSGVEHAMRLSQEPTRALSTVQVGITSIGILSGIVGESALSEPLAQMLQGLGMGEATSSRVSLFVVVVLVTFFSIVFGELLPKRMGQLSPERIACRLAPLLYWLSVLAKPFVWLLSVSTTQIMKRLHLDTATEQTVTEEEIHAMIAEGEESGVFEKAEREMVRNVFRLDDRHIGSLMTPRVDIEWLDAAENPESLVEQIRTAKHSRLVVCQDGLDNILGIGSTFNLLMTLTSPKPYIKSVLVPPLYVPETLTGMELLDTFRKTDASLALVVDEYGDVQGVVTPRDLLEAIAGEFVTTLPEEAFVVNREDGSYLLDGLIGIPELQDTLGLKHMPHEDEPGRYNTLAGMILMMIGRMPREADVVSWQGWRFEIVDMDGRRIDKVLVTREPVSEGEESDA